MSEKARAKTSNDKKQLGRHTPLQDSEDCPSIVATPFILPQRFHQNRIPRALLVHSETLHGWVKLVIH